jgi:integrase
MHADAAQSKASSSASSPTLRNVDVIYQKRTVPHPLEFAALLTAARGSGPNDPRLVCLLGMLGLRVSEAGATDITDIRYESGHELLHIVGKGTKPADIPLPIPVLRAVREAIGGRETMRHADPRTTRATTRPERTSTATAAHAVAAYLAGTSTA